MRVSLATTERPVMPGTSFALRVKEKSVFLREHGLADDVGTFKGEGLET